jgi:hypothetical protein
MCSCEPRDISVPDLCAYMSPAGAASDSSQHPYLSRFGTNTSMHAFAVALALVVTASAAAIVPAWDSMREPGLLHFQDAECSRTGEAIEDDAFLMFSNLPAAGSGECYGTSVFRSVIAWMPGGGPLPGYDVRAPVDHSPARMLTCVCRSTWTYQQASATQSRIPLSSSTQRTCASR